MAAARLWGAIALDKMPQLHLPDGLCLNSCVGQVPCPEKTENFRLFSELS